MDTKEFTPALDLVAPASRFVSASKLVGRLHRWQLVLRRSWWVLLLGAAAVLGPVYFFSASLGPVYESHARLWLVGKLNLPEDRLYTEELLNYMGTQVELLRSPMIQQMALSDVQQQFPAPPANEARPTADWRQRLRAQRQRAVAWFSDLVSPKSPLETNAPSPLPFKVTITESSKSSMLTVRVTGPEPRATQGFLNNLLQEYFGYKKQVRNRTTDRAVVSLSEQVQQLAAELKAQQEKVHAFQSSNNVVFLQEQGNSAGNYLAALNKQLAAARTELQFLQMVQPDQWVEAGALRTAAQGEVANPGEDRSRELPATLAGPQAELFKATEQADLLKARRAELSHFLRPTHPKMVKLDQEIATQEQVVAIAKSESARQLAARRQALELQIRNLEGASQEWDLKAIEASRKIADYERLRQELQRLQGTYDRLLSVIQTADLSKGLETENMGILEAASLARPVPRLFRNLLAGLVFSVVLGAGLVYLRSALDDRFDSLSELRAHFSEPILGQIPDIVLNKSKHELDLTTLENQRFDFLESFRNVRSALYFMGNGEGQPKRILVTSAVPQEGKTTVALYLAATMALGGSRVLLVDADMRRGALHKRFRTAANPGLAELLNEEVPTSQVIVPTSVPNLCILPAGEAQRSPGELVLSPQWPCFLAKTPGDFDYVLVDSPPLLATDDAAGLARGMDGVLFVVRGSMTSARQARDAMESLRQRHIRVLGLVYNRASASAYERPQYQRYRNSYGWKPNRAKAIAAVSES